MTSKNLPDTAAPCKIDAAAARKLLRYDPDTGKLYWRHRDRGMFKNSGLWKYFNKRFAFQEAATSSDRHGYRQLTLLGKGYSAHRVIWLIATGEWPDDQLDHINGDRHDNRLKNLREVSQQENLRNQKRSSKNTSGTTGVSWHRTTDLWQVRIAGKTIGYFKFLEEAIAVRKESEIEHGFHKNHGRSEAAT